MAAAAVAVMMWHRQTGKSQHGGSVSGQKCVSGGGLRGGGRKLCLKSILFQWVKCAKKYDCIRIVPMTL
ncbi:hypothetical protein BV922_21195 [Pectobacterium odoriferum]|nr:hypothetical protein BV922_21195 [Pectobacterium odoriferum]